MAPSLGCLNRDIHSAWVTRVDTLAILTSLLIVMCDLKTAKKPRGLRTQKLHLESCWQSYMPLPCGPLLLLLMYETRRTPRLRLPINIGVDVWGERTTGLSASQTEYRTLKLDSARLASTPRRRKYYQHFYLTPDQINGAFSKKLTGPEHAWIFCFEMHFKRPIYANRFLQILVNIDFKVMFGTVPIFFRNSWNDRFQASDVLFKFRF